MCGIAGIFAYLEVAPAVDRGELARMNARMAPRGPDGSGDWFSADRRVGFTHRRLAIIDLSERGAQPMHSADGRLTITFNGEIYNYRELKAELEAKGYGFRSDSDTEVLLQLYTDRGPSMVEALRGMFAFALWDSRTRQLLLSQGGTQGKYLDYDLWNAYALGANHQTGPNIIHEPLAFGHGEDRSVVTDTDGGRTPRFQ